MVEFSHPTLVWGYRSGEPLECRDEIWHQETRIVVLPDGEEITTLSLDRTGLNNVDLFC